MTLQPEKPSPIFEGKSAAIAARLYADRTEKNEKRRCIVMQNGKTAAGDPWQNLANAIIISAVKDYRKALRRQRKNPASRTAAEEIREIKRFFHSEWYGMLTDVDGNFLIRKCKEECAYDGKRVSKTSIPPRS